jgi:hypothetical protein
MSIRENLSRAIGVFNPAKRVGSTLLFTPQNESERDGSVAGTQAESPEAAR